MKIKTTILTIFLLIGHSIVLFSQKCPNNTIFINKGTYTVCYSQQFKNPLKVTYKIYKPKSLVERKNARFYKETGAQTATDEDYKNNVYDKGHLAPAETFSDTEDHLYTTFSYFNCAVQHYKLNRGVWKSLESHERQWAQNDSLLVINKVIFNQPLHPMKSGAYIPDYFEKTIKFLSTGMIRVYRFPNVEPTYIEIEKYRIK